MANIVIIGAGFAGQTAALYLGHALGKHHSITVVNRQPYFSYLPSWVWVGVGHMAPEKTIFPLKPVYDRFHVRFLEGAATEVHPDAGDQFVVVRPNDGSAEVHLPYDYLLIATGPKLNFAGTPGLGPEHGHTHSICSLPHVVETRDAYLAMTKRAEKGERQRVVIGTGHPGATCQGAALEYIANVHQDLVRRGLRDRIDLLYLSNEPALGDFGIGGLMAKYQGDVVSGEQFIGAVFDEYGIRHQVRTGVTKVEPGVIHWEDYDGQTGTTPFDFAMLIPQFLGQPMRYVGHDGADVSDKLTNAAGFITVDATYGLDHEALRQTPDAWPATYRNPSYPNIFAAGIAFAPPGPISIPHTNPNGKVIAAAPPRTGMVSGIIGRIAALNILDLVRGKEASHTERMSEMVAACIASMGDSLWSGSAAVIVAYPVVPDLKRFPQMGGRDPFVTHMEMGLSGAWMKRMLHTTFIWKLKGLPGWRIIPE